MVTVRLVERRGRQKESVSFTLSNGTALSGDSAFCSQAAQRRTAGIQSLISWPSPGLAG